MKLILSLGVGALILATSITISWQFLFPPKEIKVSEVEALPRPKSKEELISEALEKSSKIKGLYMTADVANDQGVGATRIRNNLIKLASTTEINGLIIDVKEVCGPDYNEKNLKKLLNELHQKNIWAIARIVVLKDASQFEVHPEWYLKRKNPVAVSDQCSRKKYLRVKPATPAKQNNIFWRDNKGGYWLDPASPDVQNYLAEFSKKIIDLGFDELQFDYIRFPSDGVTPSDIKNAIYPAWDGKTAKCSLMKELFEFLNKNLKAYKPGIILSADLFGYAALGLDTGIGQCIESLGDNFDYISFMLYGSHYYNGFYFGAYPARNLPPVKYSFPQARTHPDVVVERSLIFAQDFFSGKITSLNATSTIATSTNPLSRSRARLRPWLEDFFHNEDKEANRPYGVEKVRLEIDAAEKAGGHGWMLWNAANVFTEEVLKKE